MEGSSCQQLQRVNHVSHVMLGPCGFDAKRDIVSIIVNPYLV
jgi:hypothetical protein